MTSDNISSGLDAVFVLEGQSWSQSLWAQDPFRAANKNSQKSPKGAGVFQKHVFFFVELGTRITHAHPTTKKGEEG